MKRLDNPQSAISASPRRSFVSKIWNVLKFVLALLLAGFVLSRTDIKQLALLGTRIAFDWLAVSFGIYILMTLSKAVQYFFLTGRRVSYPRVLYIVVLQNTISNFIANSAGVASYLAMFKAENVKLGRSTVSFIVAKIGDLMSIWLMLMVSSILVWPDVSVLHEVTIVLLIGIGITLAAFFCTVIFRQHFVSFMRRLIIRLHLDRWELILKGINFLQAIADQEPRSIFRMFAITIISSLFYMLLTIAWGYVNLKMFSVEVLFVPVIFVTALTQLLSIIPIQVFGGLGVMDVSLLYFYGFFGIVQNELAAVLLGLRLIAYGMNLMLLPYVPLSSMFDKRS